MIELQGKYGKATIYADIVEDSVISQVYEFLNSVVAKDTVVKIMPDTHAGAGCVIGFTAKLPKENLKIVPNIVGVDIGCLDAETEILTPQGWIKIVDYNNELILVYNNENDTAFFENPDRYIKLPCEEFFHFKNSKGLDQMVSEEHRMLIYKGYKARGYTQEVMSPIELNNLSLKKGYYGFKTAFHLNQKGLGLSDDMIRLIAMMSADGSYREKRSSHTDNKFFYELHFKKIFKADRCYRLLEKLNLDFSVTMGADNDIYFYLTTDFFIDKDLTQFYYANAQELAILSEEALYWDGHTNSKDVLYYSTNKNNADVIQFAFSSNGYRTGLYTIKSKYDNHSDIYQVRQTKNDIVGYNETGEKVPSIDGYKYCFTTSTSFFVARRNNNIFITGNCGMSYIKLPRELSDEEILKLDSAIRNDLLVPFGFSVRERKLNNPILKTLKSLSIYDKLENIDRVNAGLGTLGGGNHFIEIAISENTGEQFLIVHSGSRNLGKQVAEIHTTIAELKYDKDKEHEINMTIQECKSSGREKEISTLIQTIHDKYRIVNKSLAFLDGDAARQYLKDMTIAQEYASQNRIEIIISIFEFLNLNLNLRNLKETVHNYIDTRNGIIRKGAVSAELGEELLIPINMQYGSFICEGVGNKEWNKSAPHGAGRLLARGEAKRTLSMEEYQESMKNILTSSVGEHTLDEAPMAYKDPQDIVNAIADKTVNVLDRLIPIYNFKG